MEKSEEYYRLGIRYANKLINAIFSENSKQELANLIKKEKTRTNRDLVAKEFNYLLFGVSAMLMGLNKELIEESGINSNYEYDINKKLKTSIDMRKIFPQKWIEEDKYDSWLNIINCDSLQYDFIFNVRNGILHSEFEPTDNIFIFNVHNSNYTNFEAEIFLNNFWFFIHFYFGNSNNLDVISLKPNFNGIFVPDDINEVIDENDLEKLLDSIQAVKIIRNNNNKKNNRRIFKTAESKMMEKATKEGIVFMTDDMVDSQDLTLEEKEILKKFIKTNKEDFYSIEFKEQIRFICSIYNLIKNPNYSISNWINYYVEILNQEVQTFKKYSNFMTFGTGLDKLASLFIKLSFVIYRLQCKDFEEIDYGFLDVDINSIKYVEEGTINGISPFIHAYNKFNIKYPTKTGDELKLLIFCDIIRNAVSHGHVSVEFDQCSGGLLVNFVDDYKGRKRTLKLTVDELRKFVMSDAFDPTKCVVKENNMKTKKKVL